MSYVIQELCDEIEKLKQALAEKDKAYQQLTEKALLFARNVKGADGYIYEPNDVYYEAQVFLKEHV